MDVKAVQFERRVGCLFDKGLLLEAFGPYKAVIVLHVLGLPNIVFCGNGPALGISIVVVALLLFVGIAFEFSDVMMPFRLASRACFAASLRRVPAG